MADMAQRIELDGDSVRQMSCTKSGEGMDAEYRLSIQTAGQQAEFEVDEWFYRRFRDLYGEESE